jgi:hypothetical protein
MASVDPDGASAAHTEYINTGYINRRTLGEGFGRAG